MTVAMPEGHGGGTPQHPPHDANASQSQSGQPAGGIQPATSPPAAADSGSNNINAAQSKVLDECNEHAADAGDTSDVDFPTDALARLDEMINRPRWIVPVLPDHELEVLLNAALNLTRKGVDEENDACKRFYAEGLSMSFAKILTDEAVSGWKFEIHKYILKNTRKLLDLIVLKLNSDNLYLLELLAIVLNPNSKFHTYNHGKASDTVPAGANLADSDLFARPVDSRTPGWLVDLINIFGNAGGFKLVHERFMKDQSSLSVALIAALLKPFGLCHDLLTPHTVTAYFMPLVDLVPEYLDKLTDDELKKGSKTEVKNDALSSIVKALKSLVSRIEEAARKTAGVDT